MSSPPALRAWRSTTFKLTSSQVCH
jgi:hypothetical protein